MFENFSADNADDLWLGIADRFNKVITPLQSSRVEESSEILHAALCLGNPRERWISSRSPAISPAFALAEVVWILRGRNDSKFLNYFNSKLPSYAGEGPEYHGAYGYRLRNHFSLDQIERCFQALDSNRDSRQVLLQIWDPDVDLPSKEGDPAAKDIPCNICALLKVRENRLEWTQIMRSNDVYRGLPFNIIQFTSIQEIFAGWLGIEPGSYHHYSDSLHLYQSDRECIENCEKIILPKNTDIFNQSYQETQEAVLEVCRIVDLSIQSDISSVTLFQNLKEAPLSGAWRNVIATIVAEACRRRNDAATTEMALNECSNELLNALSRRWFSRVKFFGSS